MKLVRSRVDTDLIGAPVCLGRLDKITPKILQSIHEKVVDENYSIAFITAGNINMPDLKNYNWKGLVFAEIKLALKHTLGPIETPVHPDYYVNTAYREEDLAKIYELITDLHKHSRFYHDKLLPSSFSKKVYHRWCEESLAGNWANTIYYVRSGQNDEILGLITAKRRDEGLVQSVLVVVDNKSQGKGLGKFLMNSVHSDYFKNGYKESLIITQYDNENAIAYYGKTGYHYDSMMAEFHLHNEKYKKKKG